VKQPDVTVLDVSFFASLSSFQGTRFPLAAYSSKKYLTTSTHRLATVAFYQLRRFLPACLRFSVTWLPMLQKLMVVGGDKRDRTVDLLLARQALSQLSYAPKIPSKLNK
jgi:hypothetical protein